MSDLLVSLSVLGIIASHSIPKVLFATNAIETRAKLREVVAILESSWYTTRAMNNVQYGQPFYSSVVPFYNATAMNIGGVGDASAPLQSVAATHLCPEIAPNGWVQFQNGVVISGLASGAPLDMLAPTNPAHDFTKNYVLCVDVNGVAGPNRPMQDVFIGNFNQYGGFDTPPATDPAALKSFNWGGAKVGASVQQVRGPVQGGANGFVNSVLFGAVGNDANTSYCGLGDQLLR